jgi:hypothetical protein
MPPVASTGWLAGIVAGAFAIAGVWFALAGCVVCVFVVVETLPGCGPGALFELHAQRQKSRQQGSRQRSFKSIKSVLPFESKKVSL